MNRKHKKNTHEGPHLTAAFPFKCAFVPQQYTLHIASGDPAQVTFTTTAAIFNTSFIN